jgi:DNA processing protein
MNKFIHAFNLVSGIGYVSLRKIPERFGGFQYAWEKAGASDFVNAGLTRELAGNIVNLRAKIDVNLECDKMWRKDIFLIGRESDEYPELLKQTGNSPFLLYRKGAKMRNNNFVAMVGTRVPSAYGEKMAFEIAERITLAGGIIVSGLAFGIDAICHRASVKNNMATVAVLASPVDNVTPSSHFNLSEKILAAGGTIISEYSGDTSAYKYRFLERNRIISGLCKATVVIEAAKKSGALITAEHAVKQQREVYALVGDITRPQARGCLDLIDQSKAFPIVSIESLLYGLGFDPFANRYFGLNKDEILVAEKLASAPLSIDELCEQTGFNPQILNVIITKLEIKNLVEKNEFMKWRLT